MLGLRATRLLSAEVKCLSNTFFVSQIHKVFTKIKLFSFNQGKLWLISLWRQIMTTSKEGCALMAAVSQICNALQWWLTIHHDYPIPHQSDKAHDDHLPLAQVQLTSLRLKSSLHTPLHDFHVAQGGKMVDFAGWESSQSSCHSANIWSVINQLLDPSLKTTPRYRLPVQYSDLGISASHLHTRHLSLIIVIIIIILIIQH